MIFRALAKRGKRPAALPIIGACRRYRKPGLPTFKAARLHLAPRQIAGSDRQMTSPMYGSFSASAFKSIPVKTKAAQNFKMAGWNQFPNAGKNSAENKAVSVNNSAP